MVNTDTNGIEIGRLRAMQMIVVAMALGIVIFLAVAEFSPIERSEEQDADDSWAMLTIVAVVAGVMSLPMGLLLPTVIVKVGRDKIAHASTHATGDSPGSDTSGQLQHLFQIRVFATVAVFEGAAFLAGVAYLLEHQVPALIVAGAMIVCILIQAPTHDRFRHWVENQSRRIDEARQLRGTPLSG